MATQSQGGGGNFAGTGGYGGNFGGYGGASNQSNSGGYGGTGGWGGQFGPGGYTSGLTGNQGRNNNSGNGGTASKNAAGQSGYTPMAKTKTVQTVGMNAANLGQPSTNVQTVDPLQQELYNMPEYQSIATRPTRGPAVNGGGSVGGGGGGGGIPGGPNSNGGNGWARGGIIHPGEHGWVGENGPEYAFGLKNGGVQITPNHMIGRLVGALSGRR